MRRTARSPLVATALLGVLLTVGVAWGLVSALADSASPSAASSTGDKIILQVGWYQKLDNLNPFIGYQNVSYSVYGVNYDNLVNYDAATLQPIPGLAESWEHSADGKSWTFHLRHDAVWQDGQPLTAKDVAFTFNYVVDNQMGAFTTYTNAIKHTTAVDDYTVRIDCTKPKSGILQMWVPILPEHIWGKIDPKDAETKFQNPAPCIGSGPFQVVEWKKGQYVRMQANKAYWGGAPHIDELIFRFYTNQDTMVSDLKAGNIQYAEVPQAQFATLENTSGFTTNKAQEDTFENLGINCYDIGPSKGNPVLKDEAFRHALNWAVDRESIANISYAGGARPATGFLPTDYWKAPLDYHWEPPADLKYTYDLERAKQELDAAGYTDTNGDGTRDYKGEPIKLRLWAIAEKNEYTRAAKLISGSLSKIGIKTEIQTLDDGAASEGMYNYEGDVFTPDYDLFVWGWGGDFDPGFLLSIFTTGQIENWSDCNWSNAEYDALFKQQDTELDPEARKQIIWRMQEIVYDQTPYVVLVYPLTLEAYDTAGWEGWTQQPAGSGTVQNWWTYMNIRPKATSSSDAGGGTNTGLIVALVAAGVIIVGLGIWFTTRRHAGAAEEE